MNKDNLIRNLRLEISRLKIVIAFKDKQIERYRKSERERTNDLVRRSKETDKKLMELI